MKWSSRLILALAAVVHLALLVGWRWQLLLVPYFFDATVLSGGRGLDFYSVYQAGYNARHGADVYEGDPAKVEVVVPYFTPYRYLPIVAYTVGAALSLVSPLTAYKSWVVIVELTLLFCVYITYRQVRDPDLFARLAAMWLCFTPFYLELFMGQFSFVQGALIFGMLTLAVESVEKNREHQDNPEHPASSAYATGFDSLWIISVLWKINTIIFAPVLLRLRRFRALAGAALIVALTTAPYFLVFPAHSRDFLANNFGNSVAGHELGNLGFRQLVFELLAILGASPALQRFAQLALITLILGLTLGLTFLPPYPHTPTSRSTPLGHPHTHTPTHLSLWLSAFFLISPQIWEHHHVMLLPVLVMAYRENPNRFMALLWLMFALPTPFGFIGLQPLIAGNHALRAFPLEPAWKPLLQHASKAVPTLLLFAYFASSLRRQTRAGRLRREWYNPAGIFLGMFTLNLPSL